jgi:shikimate kinase
MRSSVVDFVHPLAVTSWARHWPKLDLCSMRAHDRLMIVNLNGWPGVGKLTTARELSRLINGKLLDNHTLLNVGKALARDGSPEFYALVRAVRSAAFDAILELPQTVPVIFTNVVARGGASGFLEENWRAIIDLADTRRSDLYSVTLTCSAVENARRIAGTDRALLGKRQDPELLQELANTRVLYDDGAKYRLTVDNSDLSPMETASRIKGWIEGRRP